MRFAAGIADDTGAQENFMVRHITQDILVQGDAAPAFERVRIEVWRNFLEHGELGAACVVYHKGQKVVNLST